jgi:hypothetical protein
MPTEKQIELAQSLCLNTEGKSFRVLSAEIADTLELKAFAMVDEQGIVPGIEVEYIGTREDMPLRLVVSTVARNGYIYFKRTPKYCRAWDIRVLR